VKVARLYNFNDIRIEDISVPKIGPDDTLIRTRACGICSGDVMPWYIEKKAPLVLGHEIAGEIVGLGSLFSSYRSPFSIGDRVFVHHHAPCMDCRYCRRGDYVQCETWQKTNIIPGGISEYILIPEINLRNDAFILPEEVGYEDGTLIEPAACVVKSLNRSKIKQGDTILVIGLGVMGQIHVLLAGEFGAKRIIGADMVQFRLDKAIEFGADDVIDVSKEDLIERLRDLTDGHMADIVIVCPNSIDAMKQGMESVSKGGTVVLFAPAKPDEILNINPNELYFKDISLVTSYSCGPEDTQNALKFIQKGTVTSKKLVTHRFGIDDTETAYKITAEARDSLKCLIVF
jgi:L-iditol 2-dehydrogenase